MPNWKKVITSGSLADLSSLKLSSVINASTDTDKFLVLDSSNNVDFRTGAEVRSDIGAGTGNGTVDTSGTPVDNDFAKFTDANTIEGRSASETRSDLGLGSLATLSTVNAATITDNSVGAAELNVTGNGTTSQFLRSDGDGTFTWATPTDTNTQLSDAQVVSALSDQDVDLGTGDLTATDITVGQYIYHDGDADTYLQFDTANSWRVVTGGNERLAANGSGIQINEGSVDADFRVESNNNANMLFVDGGNDRVGIGTSSPATAFQVGDGTGDDTARVYFSDNTFTEMKGYGLQFNRSQGYIRPTSDGNKNLAIGTSGATWNILAFDANTYNFQKDEVTRLTIDTNGDIGMGVTSPDAKLHVSGASDVLLVEGSGSTVFEVQGSEGQLFSITDDLSGDIFSVSDISGIPLFNVNASDESYFTGQLEVQGLLTGSTADFSTNITLDTFVMSDSTDRSGLVLLDNNRTSGTWSGHQYTNDSGQLWGIFGNNADFGLYDDTNNEWILLYNINAGVELYYDGAKKVETTSGGIAVAGAITATGDITAFYSSDRRLKENIKPIENATEKIKKIGGYEFDWKPNDNPEMIHEGHDIGVIAQEVEAVLPEIVQDRDNGYKAVEYQKLVALLIESNKELAARVEELEKKLQ